MSKKLLLDKLILLGKLGAIKLLLVAIACSGDDDGTTREEQEKLYYTWVETDIEFWQGEDVKDDQMENFITMIKEGYAAFNTPMQESFKNNITRIHVKADDAGISHQGTVLFVGHNDNWETIGPYLVENGIILLSKTRQPVKTVVEYAKDIQKSKPNYVAYEKQQGKNTRMIKQSKGILYM